MPGHRAVSGGRFTPAGFLLFLDLVSPKAGQFQGAICKDFPTEYPYDAFSIEFESEADRGSLETEVESTLEEIANRPYTAAEVRKRLGVSNQERLRWTKDGLPRL